jgi:hypothetical protein
MVMTGRIRRWTRCTTAELWQMWREQFESDDEAIATAVWMANRLVKEAAKSTKIKFYSIKDAFIQRYGQAGQLAREEVRPCHACDNSGVLWDGATCYRCDGTGIYMTRRLYLHTFEVAGTKYRLHSYVEPKTLLDEMAADEAQYGSRFSDEEWSALALPMSGLLRILSYVAAAKWKKQLVGGRYM